MEAFVIDASMAIAWVHPAQATEESDAWLDHVVAGAELVVPAIWPLEVCNALLVLQRRRKLTAAERASALGAFKSIPVRLDHEASDSAFTTLSGVATKESLSVYDAAYLDVAVRRRLALACKDGPLRSAAARNGVPVTPE
ncbi:MAG: type II toxin-antitoxin system VapC family toxin [Gemmatimonadaceae bacterium]